MNDAADEQKKTVSEIIDEVRLEICDNYCKYMDSVVSDEDYEEVILKHCDDCPLNRL